jgi:hypothetical protein
MAGGGLMQLVAYGSQDIYLTGKPQITYWKAVYRRYTNFAIESIQQDVLGTPQFGTQVSTTISRNGDLLKRLWIEYSPQDLFEGVNISPGQTIGANIGHDIIDSVVLEIGGQIIDKQYGKWMTIWCYLTESNPTGDLLSVWLHQKTPSALPDCRQAKAIVSVASSFQAPNDIPVLE